MQLTEHNGTITLEGITPDQYQLIRNGLQLLFRHLEFTKAADINNLVHIFSQNSDIAVKLLTDKTIGELYDMENQAMNQSMFENNAQPLREVLMLNSRLVSDMLTSTKKPMQINGNGNNEIKGAAPKAKRHNKNKKVTPSP